MNNIESLGRDIIIYGRNPDNTVYKTVDRNFQPYFYIPDDNGEFTSIYGDKLKKIVISNPNDVFFEVRNYPVTFEGDVNYRIRYIIDKIEKLEKEPLRILYIDIEVDSSNGFPVPELAKMQMLSIGLYDSFDKEYIVYYLGLDDYDISDCKLIKCTTEQEMLTKFLDYLKEKDPDIISGWNVDFDAYYIYNRMKNLNMNTNLLSRDRYNCYDNVKQKKVKFFGRFIFDLLEAYKIMIPDSRENYRLDTIGDIELGFGKHKFKGDLTNLYLTDKRNFLYYNMTDVKILVELDEKRHIINFFDELRRFIKCRFEDCFARSMMSDAYILNYAHRLNVVMPSKIPVEHTEYEGAIVKRNVESGIYNNVASLDFQSLYPSCILSCNMSVETFKLKDSVKEQELENYICLENGVCFDKNIDGLVPSIIKELFELRKKYREEMKKYDMDSLNYNKFNSMQYSCKILLNVQYGIFAFAGSRIYNKQIADSITLMARNIILHSEKIVTQYGYKVGYMDSVTKDTKITIEDCSSISMEEYWNYCAYKEVNDRGKCFKKCFVPILTCDNNFKNKYIVPQSIIRHKVKKKIYRLYLTNTEYLDVTKDHSLIYIDYKSGDFMNISPKDLLKYKVSYLLFNRKLPDVVKSQGFSKSMYELMGFIIGNGNLIKQVDSKKYNYISLSSRYINVLKKGFIKNICKEYNCNYTQRNKTDLTINSTKLADMLYNFMFGGISKTKKIPLWLFKETDENICSFLRGYMSADGTVCIRNNKPIIKCDSINKNLLLGLQKLFFRVGICCSYYEESKKTRYKNVESKFNMKRINILDKFLFKKKIGFLTNVNKKLKNVSDKECYVCNDDKIISKSYHNLKSHICSVKNINGFLSKDFRLRRIIKYKTYMVDDYVYDFSISEYHKFYANNVLVSNTDSLFVFVNIKSDDIKKIINEGFVIKDLVNNSLSYFCKQNHNIDKHYFNIQYEKFYSEIYFATVLKRYFGYIIWKEGIFLEEKKFHLMGFEGKRKDTPKVSQDMQKTLFRMLLDGKSKEEIKVFLDGFIDKVKTVYTPDEIALPISYGREVYKNNPINMRAIKFSNEYFNMDIRLGDRLKYLFVTKFNKYRTDVVAIKDELPSGFVVDYQQMLRRILWLKVSPVLNSLGYRDLLPVKNRVKIKEKNRNIFEYLKDIEEEAKKL